MTVRPLPSLLSCILLLAALAAPSFASAAGSFEEQMASILAQYEVALGALVADRFDGKVTAAAGRIASEAKKLDLSGLSEMQREHYEQLPAQIEAGAVALGKAKDLEAARLALGQLSGPMTMWASMAKPDGVVVMYCPMAKAGWLQRGEQVANPYFGPDMRSCGQVGLPAGEGGMGGMDHGGKGMDHGDGMHSSSGDGHRHE